MNAPTISACLITLNEAVHLERVLRTLDFTDEIVVVDCGSTDGTLEIARRVTPKVFHHDYAGQGAQRAFAISKATGEWILVVDADEIITPELAGEIRRELAANAGRSPDEQCQGYRINRRVVFQGRLLRFGGTRRDRSLRLFHRAHGRWDPTRLVHEKAIFEGRLGTLRAPMLHFSYDDLSDYFSKFNHYTSVTARERHERGRRASLMHVWRLPYEFLRRYVFQLGCLDGYPGLLYALTASFYAFMKYAKLYELQRLEGGPFLDQYMRRRER